MAGTYAHNTPFGVTRSMFGSLGFAEIMVVVIVALIFIGPDKLPQVAKTVGKSLSDLRRVSNQLRHEFMSGMDEETAVRTPPPKPPSPLIRPAAGTQAARVDPLTAEKAPEDPTAASDNGPDHPPEAAPAPPAPPAAINPIAAEAGAAAADHAPPVEVNTTPLNKDGELS